MNQHHERKSREKIYNSCWLSNSSCRNHHTILINSTKTQIHFISINGREYKFHNARRALKEENEQDANHHAIPRKNIFWLSVAIEFKWIRTIHVHVVLTAFRLFSFENRSWRKSKWISIFFKLLFSTAANKKNSLLIPFHTL